MNLFAFLFLPNPNSATANIGLFEGYDTWAAKGVILSNALIGIAISLVYKYADALVKMIATDCTTTILMIFSALVLGTPSNLLTWFGVLVVFVAIQQYGDAGKLFAEEQARLKEAEANKVASNASKENNPDDPEKALPSPKVSPKAGMIETKTISSGGKIAMGAVLTITLVLAAIAGYVALGSSSTMPRKDNALLVMGQVKDVFNSFAAAATTVAPSLRSNPSETSGNAR
jgi:hypothetical protein